MLQVYCSVHYSVMLQVITSLEQSIILLDKYIYYIV